MTPLVLTDHILQSPILVGHGLHLVSSRPVTFNSLRPHVDTLHQIDINLSLAQFYDSWRRKRGKFYAAGVHKPDAQNSRTRKYYRTLTAHQPSRGSLSSQPLMFPLPLCSFLLVLRFHYSVQFCYSVRFPLSSSSGSSAPFASSSLPCVSSS
jgi:hypothetical protein